MSQHEKKIYPNMTYSGNRRKQYTFPIIVPPVIHKAGILHKELKNLWHIAEEDLLKATELIIYGYSCPITDIESANLIRRSVRANTNINNLIIIDSNPSIIMRYYEPTKFNTVQYFANAESLIKNKLFEMNIINQAAATKEQ